MVLTEKTDRGMNMTELNNAELSLDDLDFVSGGACSATGVALANLYSTVTNILVTFGNGSPASSQAISHMAGLATGAAQGSGCSPA
jgi:TPP-dependent pyruvate/acetoin dehydrogenase alpha subunit